MSVPNNTSREQANYVVRQAYDENFLRDRLFCSILEENMIDKNSLEYSDLLKAVKLATQFYPSRIDTRKHQIMLNQKKYTLTYYTLRKLTYSARIKHVVDGLNTTGTSPTSDITKNP